MTRKLAILYLYYTTIIIILPVTLVLVADITNWYHFSLASYVGGLLIFLVSDYIQSVIKRITEHDNK